ASPNGHPLHLFARRTPPPAEGNTCLPVLPLFARTIHHASHFAVILRSRATALRGTKPVGHGRRFAKPRDHHPRGQVLQIAFGSHRLSPDESAQRLRPLARGYPSVGQGPRSFLRQPTRNGYSPPCIGRDFP